MDLTVLNEQQLREFVRIVAEDFKIKCETLQRLRIKEAENTALTIKEDKNSEENVCLQLINAYDNSSTLCNRCNRRCRISKDTLCKLCIIRSCMERKHREWTILCPFKEEQFGHAKYLCKCPCIGDDEAWYLRAILELHIDYKLDTQIDTAFVSGVLNECREKLIQILSTYNPSKPFQYIDDAIEEIELNASENCIVRNILKKDHYNYFLFLANAVISVTISKRATKMEEETNSSKSVSKIEKITGDLHRSSKSNGSKIPSISRKVLSKQLSVKMLKKEWNVCTGDMIILFGTIISDNLDLNISWYVGAKKITNGGRYRHWRKGFDCCLEIFDCDVSDSGDILCIVESINRVTSDISILHVNDDDIAGIEPNFLQNLKFDEINSCLQLTCRISGFPIPYVTFHFRNRRVIVNQRINIDRRNDWWLLRIENCTVDDEGKYIAVARNRIGRISSSCSVILSNKNPSTYIADV